MVQVMIIFLCFLIFTGALSPASMATNAPGDNDTIAVVKVEGHNNVVICQGSGSSAQATTSAVGMSYFVKVYL